MKRTKNIARHPFGPILALMSVATFLMQPVALAQVNPNWIPTGSLNIARHYHTATLLPNGKVLVVGGCNYNDLNSAELYDSTNGMWSVTASLNAPRCLHTATLLANGKVLVVGGLDDSASAELYDPETGSWSITGSLNTARYWHTATLLANGKVLVVGGWGETGAVKNTELYDPSTGTWSVTGGLITARYGQTVTLLQNGKVLIAGGSDDGDLASTLASTELYDPTTGMWSVSSNLNASRISHTATLLPNGKVLVAGGYTDNWVPVGGGFAASPTSLNGAELYDPASGTWSITASLNTARQSHTATLLPNGKVLVAAGGYWTASGNPPCGLTASCSFNVLNNAELYDLATGTWSAAALLNTARVGHTATLLDNGKVLVAGGDNTANSNSAELYGSHLRTALDFDGDGKSDIGIYRNGAWLIVRSSDGSIADAGWGGPSWIPVPADYDGDGITDIAVYNTTNGVWSIIRSSDGGNTAVGWGGPSWTPVPADYDVMGFSFGGIQTMLAVERGPGYRVAVNCSGAAESWKGSSSLRSRLTTAASKATIPVFFLQAENDYDLTPNRVLSEEVRKAGKPVETKVYPAFGSGPRDGHSFCVRGTETWGPDVLKFIETYLQ